MESKRKPWRTSPIGWLLFLLFIQTLAWTQMDKGGLVSDYRAFYAAGYLVRTNPSQLYNITAQLHVQSSQIASAGVALPYFHPAYEALLYAPFSLLPYQLSFHAFILFNVVLLMVVEEILPISSSKYALLQRNPGLLLFTFTPLIIALLQGQDSILFLLLCCAAWRLSTRGANVMAGCLLALSLFRFQLTIPIVLLLLIRRGPRFLLGFFATACAVVGVSFAVVGKAGMEQLLQLLQSGSLSKDQGLAMQHAMAIHPLAMPNLVGLLYAGGTRVLHPAFATAVVALVSAAVFCWCMYLIWRSKNDNDRVAIALLCGVLVSYHLYIHDLSLLVLVFALIPTRVAAFLKVTTYLAAFVLFFYAGPYAYFLLAIPVLLLLCSFHRRNSAPKQLDYLQPPREGVIKASIHAQAGALVRLLGSSA